MNREILNNVLLFISLILLQVVVLNNINFLGYINPMLYILFIFFYPVKKLDSTFLILSFLLGLCIDFFANSGGVNAAATLFIAYIRIPVIKGVLGKTELDLTAFSFRKLKFGNMLTILFVLTLIHHFIVFQLEYFRLDNFFGILIKTFLTSIFTLVLLLLSFIFFSKGK
ncbi:rod shape-determining protein MreD [Namhaeicola litoreus]|uniref:Rod shape-determining protein MreD n=1 Tax=Namhaeicola litoreus TaxID=1052145 RepID=A0ABW3Y2P0_9FLAO